MSKETAFYGRLQAMTDRWMDLFGYHAPAVVTDTQQEYRAVREAAGLMDFSMLRKVDLDGAGALALVDSTCVVTSRRSARDVSPTARCAMPTE
jgi:aminomethyltransferase